MSVWDKIMGFMDAGGNGIISSSVSRKSYDSSLYAVFDVEVGVDDKKVHDIGAVRYDNGLFHKASKKEFLNFIKDVDYLCGHNIIDHDAKYIFEDASHGWRLVDTLYMSPLLFPEHPYHKLLKDDKLISEQINNPLNDSQKAYDLLWEEVESWRALSDDKRNIFIALLKGKQEFDGFLNFVGAEDVEEDVVDLIRRYFKGLICEHVDVQYFVENLSCALAYALALIDTKVLSSITPRWVLYRYPEVEHVIKVLRYKRCETGCEYCDKQLDIHQNLNCFFGYSQFRTYEGEPLQERAAQAAVDGKSLLAIFPTGGGKSLTFQLPALMEGKLVHGLTVVISPLQSLMKDQVDNLADRGISDAAYINGLLDPVSRSIFINRVLGGEVSLLYVAPEMLRSKTLERILMGRHVVRFVIDEAHCFSSWGQDFRVDYLYIGTFIRKYQDKKRCRVPVSCFTATAKQKVVQDICDYFKQTLDLDLQLYASTATRTNLHYSVIHTNSDEDKYLKLRNLITMTNEPTIVYVARVRRTIDLANRLRQDGFDALPFNGKMNSDDKVANQEAFMSNRVRIIVATSAFGMGVDKSDVGLVVHYDISDSLENYVQEAGRAGRDPKLSARCYVLYGDNDLDKHFILLNQSKLSISEIQQVWKVVKTQTKVRSTFSNSALEIARMAGWDDSVVDIEMRVRTAISALEQAGYLERGNNVPHVFADGITVKNMDEAHEKISSSILFDKQEAENAIRIIRSLISKKYTTRNEDSNAESRVDYLADILGLSKVEVVSAIERMKQEGILADNKDITAFLYDTPGDNERKANVLLENFANIERYIIGQVVDGRLRISYKQLNEDAIKSGITISKEKDIRTLLYFLSIKGYIRKDEDITRNMEIVLQMEPEVVIKRLERRVEVCRFIINWLYNQYIPSKKENNDKSVQFSVVGLLNVLKSESHLLFDNFVDLKLGDVEESLFYLYKIGALKLDGGFLVLYNALTIRRIKDNKARYKIEDYKILSEFYKQKIQQVHIVGEYANLMVKDYNAALQYVQDYFQMDYKKFISKYFKGERVKEIERNITASQYERLFGQLSKCQTEIISDKESRCIVVAAGPGSGKTRVLVHKLASLLMLEDVKHEQLLMLTFSRAAATEFKQRLMDLIGNAAYFVEIKTFHSYCFDLLGRIGNLEEVKDVVSLAAQMIENGDVEPNKIGKSVLVIDEAQDMSFEEYALVKALMSNNEDMRVIAVGDDDQNIFEFRGSDSNYMFKLLECEGSRLIEMTENYRSSRNVIDYANSFVNKISDRKKSSAIVPIRDFDGNVEMVLYKSEYIYQPIVNHILRNGHNGTTAILTQTNEEAAIIVALLRQNGINSKLIQSMDGFPFMNLAEVRYFLKHLSKGESSPCISQVLWDKTKELTYNIYAKSQSLIYLKRCVEQFESVNRYKYYSDFREFIYESAIEDFCDISEGDVVVSTIHKSKGREFDNVYMLLAKNFSKDNSLFRRYYVGMTRAKNSLFIHTNDWQFHKSNIKPIVDSIDYSMPSEVVLQLTHHDVFLGFFKNRKRDVLALFGGDDLYYKDSVFYVFLDKKPVAKLSNKMLVTLNEWIDKGYSVKSASVRFIVAWKAKDAPKEEAESAVILIDMVLNK